MSAIKDLPALILGYNRFDKFSRCITTLYEQGIKKVYISIDGPKMIMIKNAQKNIKNFCKKINLGLDINLKSLKENMDVE